MVIVDRLYTKTGDGRSVWVGTSYIDGNTWILHTDYGTASYHWGSPGTKTLKEFLAAEPNGRVDTNYLLRKLWQEPLKLKEIDWDATRKNLWDGFKESLYDEKYRGKEPLDWERARERYEHLRDSESFESYYNDDLHDLALHDAYEYIIEKNTDSANLFAERVLIPFCFMFRDQLATDKDTGWVWSTNEEVFQCDPYPTKEAAIADARVETEEAFFVGKTRPVTFEALLPKIGEGILEDMDEALYDLVNEVAEDKLHASPEATEDLTKRIQATVVEWGRHHRISPDCFIVENIEQFPLAES